MTIYRVTERQFVHGDDETMKRAVTTSNLKQYPPGVLGDIQFLSDREEELRAQNAALVAENVKLREALNRVAETELWIIDEALSGGE